MNTEVGFSGSYARSDVTFLLEPIRLEFVSIEEKERLLQSRSAHYSELLSAEYEPTELYLREFRRAVQENGPRFAYDLLRLAGHIAARVEGRIVLVSLARAGTPVGVLLCRLLAARFGRDVVHYSISIIAGRGIDEAALDHIRQHERVADQAIVFVDGWTGKGVIGRALGRAIDGYNARHGARLDATLHVVTDLCGSTRAASTTEDYLIPNSLLGATVSGLVSRSILNVESQSLGRFHGCRYYAEWEAVDRSRAFVDEIERHTSDWSATPALLPERDLASERATARGALERVLFDYGYENDALIKPGIGEATRAVLRRRTELILIRSEGDPHVAALRTLASEKAIPMRIAPNLPWRAVSLIGRVHA